MRAVTEKQSRVLQCLQEHARLRGHCPTYRDLAAELHLSLKSVYQHVLALEKKGLLSRRGRGGLQLAENLHPARGVPLLCGAASAGPSGLIGPMDECIDLVADLGLDLPSTVLLRVRGTSMAGRGVQDGDLVVVRPDLPISTGDVAAVVLGDDTVVKTIKKRDGHLRLFSEPDGHGARQVPVPRTTVPRICGRVVAAVRFIGPPVALERLDRSKV